MVRAREAEREWAALAVAAFVAAVAGVIVSTTRNPVPWYLVGAIALAIVVGLVAVAVLVARPLVKRRADRAGAGPEEPLL
jgi:hypothetical protein